MIAGKLGQESEIGGCLHIGGRDGHEPRQIKACRSCLLDKARQGFYAATALLRFVADIDLDEAGRVLSSLLLRLGERRNQRRAIDRVDDVEKRDRIVGLVRLQLADQMKLDIRIFGAQSRPFGLGFLHPVFAEAPVPGFEERADRFGIMSFCNGDQFDVFRAPARQFRRARDIRLYASQPGLCVFVHPPAIGRRMPKRYSRHQTPELPRLWLMTDERMGEALIPAIRRLPKGSGVIFRHYSLPPGERRMLFGQIERLARARRLTLLSGGRGGAHGRHFGALTAPVHSLRERIVAERNGVRLVFVSPIFPTASHPGARTLGRVRFGLVVAGSKVPVIALGGMTHGRARSLSAFGIYGWAAISSLTD